MKSVKESSVQEENRNDGQRAADVIEFVECLPETHEALGFTPTLPKTGYQIRQSAVVISCTQEAEAGASEARHP